MKQLMSIAAVLAVGAAVHESSAADFLYSCPTLGGDGGTTIVVTGIAPATQFMVSTPYSVQYRACKGTGDDGGPPCTATSTDAPIAANAQTDLCMPSGYNRLSFYKANDGGNPSVCVYNVNPKTVCQLNSP